MNITSDLTNLSDLGKSELRLMGWEPLTKEHGIMSVAQLLRECLGKEAARKAGVRQYDYQGERLVMRIKGSARVEIEMDVDANVRVTRFGSMSAKRAASQKVCSLASLGSGFCARQR